MPFLLHVDVVVRLDNVLKSERYHRFSGDKEKLVPASSDREETSEELVTMEGSFESSNENKEELVTMEGSFESSNEKKEEL